MRTIIAALFAGLCPVVALPAAPVAARPVAPDVRLYTLDCGRLEIGDMTMFSETGEHAGEPGMMAVPCYLIRHGDDWLLRDTGLGDGIAVHPGGIERLGGRWTVTATLAAQLARLGLTPDCIRYVSLSHLHADHSGNIALFPKATWLGDPAELDQARTRPAPIGVEPSSVRAPGAMTIQPIAADHDMFGDGSVRILRAPGHTPDHRILLVRLRRSGAVLRSGDLFHSRENYGKTLVPPVDVSRADTLASAARFRGLAVHAHARVVIQHAPEDFRAMPAFPASLD